MIPTRFQKRAAYVTAIFDWLFALHVGYLAMMLT